MWMRHVGLRFSVSWHSVSTVDALDSLYFLNIEDKDLEIGNRR
jgi:hypothetical protein